MSVGFRNFAVLIIVFTTSILSDVDYSCLHKTAWALNLDDRYNDYFSAFTDVSSSRYVDDSYSWKITASGIPSYNRSFTTTDINKLNSRPDAVNDFRTLSQTTANVGNYIEFGQDIGYVNSGSSSICVLGYWPPLTSISNYQGYGGCPLPYDFFSLATYTTTFTLSPSPEIGAYNYGWKTEYIIGRAVNGILLYSGISHLNYGTWSTLTPELDYYSLDPCDGYASYINDRIYHHRSYSTCLASQLKEDGSGHSRTYGFAMDGYPIYGPYQDLGVLAQSCWQLRDYSTTSVTGCSTNARTCQLIDEFDFTHGVIPSPSGPAFTDTILSTSGNLITAVNGVYYEDYFYNSSCTELSEAHLNQYNGHTHDDFGFHYHMTIDSAGDPVFPYISGPRLYGCIADMPGSLCGESDAVMKGHERCSSQVSGSSNSISPFIIFTLVIALLLFGSIFISIYCITSCIRRMKSLVPLPSYIIGRGEDHDDYIGNLPPADAVAQYKDMDMVVGVEVISSRRYGPNGSYRIIQSPPVATATAVAIVQQGNVV